MEKKKSKKIIDGRFKLGIVTNWIMRQNLSIQEVSVYLNIALQSCNVYHKRSPNIKMDTFKMDKKTLAKHRAKLIELGYIGFRRTKTYSAYWLIEPKIEMRNFLFKNDFKFTKDTSDDKKLKIDLFG